MKITYGLKTSQPTTFVQPLVKYLQVSYDMQTAYTFKPILTKVNELRNRATSISMRPESSPEQIDKNIQLLSAYTKYALVIYNRFNWNSDRGKCVEGLELTWFDSFQQKLEFSRHTILFDVFCCYYNLAVMYITRALKLSEVELDSSRKDAIAKAKSAAFLLKEMKEKYYGEFVNVGFHDTQFPHLDILENISMGLVYKCVFEKTKEIQYKIGINKVAAVCGTAAKYYFKAYSVASTYFLNPSGISDKTKSQILALTYFQSLYLDVMTNTRYAKYYVNEVERDHSMMAVVIAYERKALRLLELGLKNQSVEALINQHAKQKNQLIKVMSELKESLSKNLMRNKEIYKQKELRETEIPPTDDLPQEYRLNLQKPQNLVMENEGEFANLMSEESYGLAQQLIDFSKNKKTALETSMKKLDEEVDKVYNQSYVNFYLQMVSDQKRTIPKKLQQKLLDIRKLGGKPKLDQLISTLTERQKNANKCFMQLRQKLNNQEYTDSQKRSQYGNLWTRAASNTANKQYMTTLDNYEGKFKIATGVDTKILEKYQKNYNYIQALNATDEQILAILPKPEQTMFAEANKLELSQLRQKSDLARKRRDNITQLSHQILDALNKINYPIAANNMLVQQTPKQQIFKVVFAAPEQLITKFNAECAAIKQDVKIVATIAISLNNKNKQSDSKSKRQFEVVINTYSEIAHIFPDCAQANAFYDKLETYTAKLVADVEDFIHARKMSAQELEGNIQRKGGNSSFGGGGGLANNLPEMYPGQQKAPVPEFVPPPIPPSLFDQGQSFWQTEKSKFNPMQGGMQGPQFPSNPFKGPVYQQKMQQPQQAPLQFPSNPFAGQVFKSQFVKK